MMKWVIIEVKEPQIQLVDSKNRGCLICALEAATVQARCGLVEGERVSGGGREGREKDLQLLVFRQFEGNWAEAAMSSVRGVQVHVAPADVDRHSDRLWLPGTAFKRGGEEGKTSEPEDFDLESVMLDGEGRGGVNDGRKYGIFLPVFLDTDDKSDNSVEADALVVHSGSMPSAVVRAEAAQFSLGVDQQQLRILASIVSGWEAEGEEEEKEEEKKEEGEDGNQERNGKEVEHEEGLGFEAVNFDSLTMAGVWERRQVLSWEQRLVEATKQSLLENREDAIAFFGERELAEKVELLDKKAQFFERRGKEALKVLKKRVSLFTLRTRQLEVRPNLQFHTQFACIILELKVKPENDQGGGEGRDPFLRLKLDGMHASVSSYEGGDFSLQLSLHNVCVDSFSRIHSAAALTSVRMFGGFTNKHALKMRGRGGKLPPCFDEDGVEDMVSVVVVIGTSSVKGVGLVRLIEVRVAPVVVAVTKSQVVGLIEWVKGGLGRGKREKKEDKMLKKAKDKFVGGGEMVEKRNRWWGKLGGAGAEKMVGKVGRGVNRGLKKGVKGVGGGLVGVGEVVGEGVKGVGGGLRKLGSPRGKKGGGGGEEEGGGGGVGIKGFLDIEQVKSMKIAWGRLRLGEVNLFVSYKGEGWIGVEDFEDLHVKVHMVKLENKVKSLWDMGLMLRTQVVLDVLGQVGRNFENIGLILAQKFNWGDMNLNWCAGEGVLGGCVGAAVNVGAGEEEGGGGEERRILGSMDGGANPLLMAGGERDGGDIGSRDADDYKEARMLLFKEKKKRRKSILGLFGSK